ncbi:RNA-directed DNA polymerase from mobile element jockey, partial [Astathelohania contejeani]
AINIIYDAVSHVRTQNHVALIATRDVNKAFDSLWHEGVLYKLQDIPAVSPPFLRLINNFLCGRKILPCFNGKSAAPFTPTAGVPQGSCLSPVLFNTFVNDLPQPKYRDTIITQFADDVIHVVSSLTGSLSSKHSTAVRKLNEELVITERWERKWRLVTNPDKIQVSTVGCMAHSIENLGGVRVGGTPISIKNSNTILGYNINRLLNSSDHVQAKTGIAKGSLARLFRFRQAPTSVKLHLYKMLIRPLLEYPSTPLDLSTRTNQRKLQRVQNKALRFAANLTLDDRVPMVQIHEFLEIEPINRRLCHLSRRILYHMKDQYIPDRENALPILNSTPDYDLREPPQRTRRITLQQRVIRHIHSQELPGPRILSNLPDDPDTWTLPAPIYT